MLFDQQQEKELEIMIEWAAKKIGIQDFMTLMLSTR